MPQLPLWQSTQETLEDAQSRSKNHNFNYPRAVISVDQLKSPLPGLFPLPKEHLLCEGNEVPQCLSFTQVILLTCIFMKHSLVKKPLMLSMLSNDWLSNMGYASYTTIVTMEELQTKLLWMMFTRHIKQSPFVALELTTKMALLNVTFATSLKVPTLPYYMLPIDQPKQL